MLSHGGSYHAPDEESNKATHNFTNIICTYNFPNHHTNAFANKLRTYCQSISVTIISANYLCANHISDLISYTFPANNISKHLADGISFNFSNRKPNIEPHSLITDTVTIHITIHISNIFPSNQYAKCFTYCVSNYGPLLDSPMFERLLQHEQVCGIHRAHVLLRLGLRSQRMPTR